MRNFSAFLTFNLYYNLDSFKSLIQKIGRQTFLKANTKYLNDKNSSFINIYLIKIETNLKEIYSGKNHDRHYTIYERKRS